MSKGRHLLALWLAILFVLVPGTSGLCEGRVAQAESRTQPGPAPAGDSGPPGGGWSMSVSAGSSNANGVDANSP